MLIGENFIYFALQKTGCTYTMNILKNIPSINLIECRKHGNYDDIPENFRTNLDSMIKIGNIRNPWEWYVSLWAYGCLKKGGFRERIFNESKNNEKWNYLYSNQNNPVLFREWLSEVLTGNLTEIEEEYFNSPLSSTIGFFTYRYMDIYVKDFYNFKKKSHDYIAIKEKELKDNFIDIILRKENLSSDILLMHNFFGLSEREVERVLVKNKRKKNTSKHKHFSFYYDNDTCELVRKKDALIVDKYGYNFNSLD